MCVYDDIMYVCVYVCVCVYVYVCIVLVMMTMMLNDGALSLTMLSLNDTGDDVDVNW